LTDEELLAEMSRGNGAAWETLIYRYHAPIHAYLNRMLGSAVWAEDYTQECFLRVMKSVKMRRLPESFRPWLYRIASNLCRDHWRKGATRREVLDADAGVDRAANDNVAIIFEKQWEREAVIEALEQLQGEQKDLIILRFYQELKLQEIAQVLELPLSTVKTRLYQTLKELQSLLTRGEVYVYGKREKSR
jgi:RNA polymerase sigma factor (sigma-70 family)